MRKSRSENLNNVHNGVTNLSPLKEGPELEEQLERRKKEKSWKMLRTWVYGTGALSQVDLKLVIGVLGCPLSPLSCPPNPVLLQSQLKQGPMERRSAQYIVQQYLAAAGCGNGRADKRKSMYVIGSVRLSSECELDYRGGRVWSSNGGEGKGDNGCFVLWQMWPGMWLVELVVGGHKVVAGCNGKVVWRCLPWLGTSAAKGPHRPLRRLIQGLDPNTTASMFTDAQYLGEKQINGYDCFVLRASVDRASISERNNGQAEVIRHVIYGYFGQKTGLLMSIEDSHLTRVQSLNSETVYWETTIGTMIDDYKEVDGILIAHKGRSIATIFRFGEELGHSNRSVMEEIWTIDDVAFNVPGLSLDCFIPPMEILELDTEY